MSLREQLADDLKDALRQQDEQRKRTIRSVLAAMKQAETELDASGQRVHLDDDGLRAIVVSQIRQRDESIVEYQKGRRPDLVAEEEAEKAILQIYLPRQLTREEIVVEARRVIAQVGASGPRDLGKVMKPLVAGLKGRADGKVVNEVVRELLAG
jgi:uncharacterized protein YqeY